MKKLLILLLCAAMLCSCNIGAVASADNSAAIPDEQYLTGLNPQDIGLSFKAPANMPLTLSPSAQLQKDNGEKLKFQESYLLACTPKVRIYPTRLMSYIGCMQAVFARMQQMSADKEKLDGAYVLNFQLFAKADFVDGKYAKIYEMDIPYIELEKLVFYSTDSFVAVDLTDYMLGNAVSEPITLEEHIALRWKNGNPDEQYALDLRDYVKDNMASFLQAE